MGKGYLFNNKCLTHICWVHIVFQVIKHEKQCSTLHILIEMQINEVSFLSPTSNVFCLHKKHHSPSSSNQIPRSYLSIQHFLQLLFSSNLLPNFERCYFLIAFEISWFPPLLLLPPWFKSTLYFNKFTVIVSLLVLMFWSGFTL